MLIIVEEYRKMIVITTILTKLVYYIEMVGGLTICVGVFGAIAHLVAGYAGLCKPISVDKARLQVGRAIVFAVEILLASDILRTMITPDYYSIGLLACLVVIRSALTYFLHIELKGL